MSCCQTEQPLFCEPGIAIAMMVKTVSPSATTRTFAKDASQTHARPAVDGLVVAVAGLADSVRPDAKQTLELLARSGWKLGILSGDHPEVVRGVAEQLGPIFEGIAGAVSPEQKLEIVRRSTHETSPVVMVGDGVNDSAALAMATVGIAVKGGAEASLAAAPVYLGKPGLAAVHTLIRASRSTSRTIQINFLISILYNVVGVGLAMTGMINPLVAALLMPLSSLTVIGISLRSGNGRR